MPWCQSIGFAERSKDTDVRKSGPPRAHKLRWQPQKLPQAEARGPVQRHKLSRFAQQHNCSCSFPASQIPLLLCSGLDNDLPCRWHVKVEVHEWPQRNPNAAATYPVHMAHKTA